VNREDIYLGIADLGITLDDHIPFTLQALTAVAEQLGL
jgi:predicted hydrolase (HD superfamily)